MSENIPNDTNKKVPSIYIRQMKFDDLPVVFHLGEKVFTARDSPNLYRTWDEYEIISTYQTDNECCLIAETDDEVIGFLLGSVIEKSRSSWSYGYLGWLGVIGAYRKQGIGLKLFRHFRDLMLKAGVRIVLVDTQADNETALQFFRKVGFANEEKHIYLSLNIDSLRKSLNQKKRAKEQDKRSQED
jgi:ribosomal protein S18 acetylase RimI-like enzyme